MRRDLSQPAAAISTAIAIVSISFLDMIVAAPVARAEEVSFSCEISKAIGGGKANCGQVFDLPAGAVLQVDLISSGGTKVKFCAKQSIGDIELGCSTYIDPGAVSTVVYQNPSAGPYGIQVTAEVLGTTVVDVLAQGRFTYPK